MCKNISESNVKSSKGISTTFSDARGDVLVFSHQFSTFSLLSNIGYFCVNMVDLGILFEGGEWFCNSEGRGKFFSLLQGESFFFISVLLTQFSKPLPTSIKQPLPNIKTICLHMFNFIREWLIIIAGEGCEIILNFKLFCVCPFAPFYAHPQFDPHTSKY